MEAFIRHSGVAIPLDRSNVNTDDIIPARFLKTIKRSGFEASLFANWRYLADDRTPNPAFALNQSRYQGGSILVAGDNFGCGSSREHAPWALHDFGIKSIIAPNFADIFYNNCLNNGILPVSLSSDNIEQILQEIEAQEGYTLTINLEQQTVAAPHGQTFNFAIDSFRKQALLQGLDNIGWTLSHHAAIEAYEQARYQEAPWVFVSTQSAFSTSGAKGA